MLAFFEAKVLTGLAPQTMQPVKMGLQEISCSQPSKINLATILLMPRMWLSSPMI